MSKYSMDNGCNCSSSYNIVSGNSLDLDVNYCESEIRADIVVSEHNSVRLWGRVVNCEGEPISCALIKLLKVECNGSCVKYHGVAHTISDCDGFYQFELCDCPNTNDCYKLLVSKAAYGPERIIPAGEGNCDPCNCDPCDPCKEFPPIVTPPGHSCEDNCGCNCNSNSYYSKSKM